MDNEIKGEGNSLNYTFRMHDPRIGRFFAVDPLFRKYPHNSPYAFSENRVIDGIDLEGLEFYYTVNGQFLGKVGDSQDVYTADEIIYRVSECSDGTLGLEVEFPNANNLNIKHSKFISKASAVYGESSHAYKIDSKEEVFAIASVHQRNKVAYGTNSAQAKVFRNTPEADRNGTFMQTAIAAEINAINSGTDYSYGATMWDGQEQSLIDSDIYSSGGFEYHMNTMGWTISDDHYESWKEAVGSKFKAPPKKYTPGKYSGNKFATANTIALKSTAQYGKTIFWKELKKRLVKPVETPVEVPSETKQTDEKKTTKG